MWNQIMVSQNIVQRIRTIRNYPQIKKHEYKNNKMFMKWRLHFNWYISNINYSASWELFCSYYTNPNSIKNEIWIFTTKDQYMHWIWYLCFYVSGYKCIWKLHILNMNNVALDLQKEKIYYLKKNECLNYIV